MRLAPDYARWLSRVYTARIASWTYLAAVSARGLGVTVVIAPFLVLFWSPALPEALTPSVRVGPQMWVGLLLGLVASGVEGVTARTIRRRLGEPPAKLEADVTPLTLLPMALAQHGLARQAASAARASDTPLRGWVATGLWLYGAVLGGVVLGGLIVGVIGGTLTVG